MRPVSGRVRNDRGAHETSGGRGGKGRGKPPRERNTMRLYDILQEGAIKAHLAIPDAGPPTWDFSPDALGGHWMDDALRKAL